MSLSDVIPRHQCGRLLRKKYILTQQNTSEVKSEKEMHLSFVWCLLGVLQDKARVRAAKEKQKQEAREKRGWGWGSAWEAASEAETANGASQGDADGTCIGGSNGGKAVSQ